MTAFPFAMGDRARRRGQIEPVVEPLKVSGTMMVLTSEKPTSLVSTVIGAAWHITG